MGNMLAGAVIMGNVVAAIFFWRFWYRTRDQLFAMFGAAFLLLAVHRVLVGALSVMREEQSWIYLIRLAAFVLIIIAVLLKNAESRPRLPS